MSAVVNTFQPLRHPPFRRLMLGLLVSRLGDQFTIIALLWFLLALTGSGAAGGLAILFFRVPAVVTGPLIGRLLDRYPPAKLMAADNFIRAVLISAISVLYWRGALNTWTVYALVLAAGAVLPATEVGTRALIPYLVSDEELNGANALSSMSWEVSFLVGPAVSGVLVSALGGPWVLLIDAGTFVVLGTVLLTLPSVARTDSSGGPQLKDRWSGFGALFRQKELLVITVLTLTFFFAYGPLESVLPVYAQNSLGVGPAGYGLLWSAFGVGSVLGLLINHLFTRIPPGRALPSIISLWGICLLPIGIVRSLPLAMIFMGFSGFIWAPYMVIETSLVQRLAPASLRGQIFGARATLNITGTPLGAAVGGFLVRYTSPPVVIALSALACVMTGVAGLLSPALRSLEGKAADGSTSGPAAQVPGAGR